MKYLLLASLSVTIFAGSLNAETRTYVSNKKSVVTSEKLENLDLPTENESWYIFFDLGAANHSFGGEFKEKKNDFEKFAPNGKESSHVGYGLSLGFYFPFNNHKSMFGPYVAVGSSDNEIANNSGDRFSMETQRIDLALSAQHYFGKNIGSGFFLRGDLGASYQKFEVTYETGTTGLNCVLLIFCVGDRRSATVNFRDGTSWTANYKGDRKRYNETSIYGLFGLGYSFKLGNSLRMQALLSHSVRPSGFGTVNSTNLGLGLLF